MARRRIATRNAALVAALLALALITSGAVEAWVSHRERVATLETLQREKARAAAAAVSRFAEDILRSLYWVSLSTARAGEEDLEQRRLEFVKLLRLEPAITTATLVDAAGRERLRVSRIETDRIGSGHDLSGEAGFATARAGKTHFAEVEFVAQSEPYLTIAVPSAMRDGSVVLANVNLKFVRTVVSDIRVGKTGYAYVVDARGRLVSHPDLSLVLQMRDLATLPQVSDARGRDAADSFVADGRDLAGAPVLAAYARVAPLNWSVFVEQPRTEAMAPLVASAVRSAVILLVALGIAVVAGAMAARRMVAPIGELHRGARKFGAGDLAHRIDIASGDELEELAAQFNAMASRLRETYESLERRVAERTRDLDLRNAEVTEALEQQTATAEILRVISSSPTDTRPVFRTIIDHATRLCEANFAAVFLLDGERLYATEHTAVTPAFAQYLRSGFPISRATTTGRAALARRPVQIVDVLADPDFDVTPAHRSEGLRTVLSVPMLRDGKVIGLINAWRREVRPFTEKQMQLLETFAQPAVIALENLRLFNEIQATSRALEQANQAKSRFLAAASHDLRQPMHALSLFVGQLHESSTAAERALLAQRIEQAVGALSHLLDQLLDLSRLEAGAVQAVHEDFALRDTLATIESQFGPLARAKGLQLRIRCPAIAARSDPLLVQRILLNLVANAIRYTERGGVLVACRQRAGRVRIAVWDTGCGIPDDRREDVFREFVQLGGVDRRRPAGDATAGHGLGLGLAIVARLAELLGTRIDLISRLGRGSMFAFDLPIGVLGSVPRLAAQPVDALAGVFAIVVDDDETARNAMCGLLERWGCLTVSAATGDDALAQLVAHDRPPELIVCDFRLEAGTDGLDVIERMRAAIGEPVAAVLVTADSGAEVLQAARARGIPVVRKPASPLRLRAVLAQVLATPTQEEAA